MSDPFGFESLSLEWLTTKPGAKWHRYPGLINAWVADMDFPPPAVVLDGLRSLLDGGDLGYPDHLPGPSGAATAWSARCGRRYGWTPPLEECRELNDVTQGIQIVLDLFTAPGDGVLVYQPSYPPFLRSVEESGRTIVPMVGRRSAASSTGWAFDLDEFEAVVVAQQPRAFLMCHPHNPTGHVYSDEELRGIATIAERAGMLVISDEIHADLTYAPAVHRPMALFLPEQTVTIQAASKAFNLAGLRYAIMHIGHPRLRDQILGQPDHLYGEANLFGSVAAEVAWERGDEWLAAVVAHLDSMRRLAVDLLNEKIPEIIVSAPAATYLAWLDCRALDLGGDPSVVFAEHGVQLSEGPTFGPEGIGCTRLNFATSSSVLGEIVGRMARVRRGR